MVFFFKKKKQDHIETGSNTYKTPPANELPPPMTSSEAYSQHNQNKGCCNSRMQHSSQSFIKPSESRLYPSENTFTGYRLKDTEYHDKNSDVHVSVHVNSLPPKDRDSNQYYVNQSYPYVSTNGNSYEHFTYACNNPTCQVGNVLHNEHTTVNGCPHDNPWTHISPPTSSKQCSHRPSPQYSCQPMIHTTRPLPVNNTSVPATSHYHHHPSSSHINASHSHQTCCQKSYPTPRLPIVVPLHSLHPIQSTRAFYPHTTTPTCYPSYYPN
jgi:hypothetical protein